MQYRSAGSGVCITRNKSWPQCNADIQLLVHAAQRCKLNNGLHSRNCRLFVRDKRKLKTQVKENTTRPEWNEEFQLLVHEPEHQYLTLLMYDHDVLSVDDEIGSATFRIRNLRNGEEEEVDVEVKPEMPEAENQMMVRKVFCADLIAL